MDRFKLPVKRAKTEHITLSILVGSAYLNLQTTAWIQDEGIKGPHCIWQGTLHGSQKIFHVVEDLKRSC